MVFSGIHSPSVFAHGLGSVAVRGSVRCRNIGVAIAAPSVELDLRARCGTVFQHPHGFPDRVYNPLNGAKRGLAPDGLAFSTIVALGSNSLVGQRIRFRSLLSFMTASWMARSRSSGPVKVWWAR